MKILIVGGGVAGTALAGFLKGHADVTLIDKTPQWGDIGYALALWGNGRKILRKLGIENEVLKEGYELPWAAFENEQEGLLKSFTFQRFEQYGPTMIVSRTALHRALIKNLGSETRIRLGTTVGSLTQDEKGVKVTFSDGASELFNLVVGADGIHSQIRELVFGKTRLKWYGWSIWAFWTPKGFLPPRGAIELLSGGKMYFEYPLEDRAVVMFGAAIEPRTEDPLEHRREELQELFKNFHPLVNRMISAVEKDVRIFHDDLAYIDMAEWYNGRVALMGDAQHGSSPVTGMGASMALEDAFVLAEELLKTGAQSVPAALERYTRRRSARIRKFRKASRFVERWTMVESPVIAKLRNFIIYFLPMGYFLRNMEKILQEEI